MLGLKNRNCELGSKGFGMSMNKDKFLNNLKKFRVYICLNVFERYVKNINVIKVALWFG